MRYCCRAHSLRRATVGSFLEAMREGMKPASTESNMLTQNMATHCHQLTCISPEMPRTAASSALPAKETATATMTPMAPE